MRRLVVNPDTAEEWVIELYPGAVTLGRGGENDFPIEHPSVSSSHCRISTSDAGVWLKDLGSTAGTYADGELVEELKLKPGQLIQLGEVVMRFYSDTPQNEPPRARPLTGAYGAQRRPMRTPHSRTNAAARAGFFASMPGALVYPFQGSGVILLIAGTTFFYILGKLPLLGLIITGYLFSYAKHIITSTAEGRRELPDWPDFSDWKDDILIPYVHLVALVIVAFGPSLIIAAWQATHGGDLRVAFFCALAFGLLLAPMGMLALTMFDSLLALNPIPLIMTMGRVPLQYLAAAATFEAGLALYWFAEGAIKKTITVPILPALLSSFLYLYLLAVGMRILGLLYLNYSGRFGWFSPSRA